MNNFFLILSEYHQSGYNSYAEAIYHVVTDWLIRELQK